MMLSTWYPPSKFLFLPMYRYYRRRAGNRRVATVLNVATAGAFYVTCFYVLLGLLSPYKILSLIVLIHVMSATWFVSAALFSGPLAPRPPKPLNNPIRVMQILAMVFGGYLAWMSFAREPAAPSAVVVQGPVDRDSQRLRAPVGSTRLTIDARDHQGIGPF